MAWAAAGSAGRGRPLPRVQRSRSRWRSSTRSASRSHRRTLGHAGHGPHPPRHHSPIPMSWDTGKPPSRHPAICVDAFDLGGANLSPGQLYDPTTEAAPPNDRFAFWNRPAAVRRGTHRILERQLGGNRSVAAFGVQSRNISHASWARDVALCSAVSSRLSGPARVTFGSTVGPRCGAPAGPCRNCLAHKCPVVRRFGPAVFPIIPPSLASGAKGRRFESCLGSWRARPVLVPDMRAHGGQTNAREPATARRPGWSAVTHTADSGPPLDAPSSIRDPNRSTGCDENLGYPGLAEIVRSSTISNNASVATDSMKGAILARCSLRPCSAAF
jgi:hypothetical protein